MRCKSLSSNTYLELNNHFNQILGSLLPIDVPIHLEMRKLAEFIYFYHFKWYVINVMCFRWNSVSRNPLSLNLPVCSRYFHSSINSIFTFQIKVTMKENWSIHLNIHANVSLWMVVDGVGGVVRLLHGCVNARHLLICENWMKKGA